MALHYVIDGYNLIRSADWLAAGPLRDQRERLLRWIEERRPQGSPANRVTVVFDGQPDVAGPPWPGPTAVRFSSGPDADKVIKDLVDGPGNPRAVVVVTDDRGIQRWVRGAGARVMSCGAFLAAARRRRGSPDRLGAARSPRPAAPSSAKTLDPAAAGEINEELKDLWKLK